MRPSSWGCLHASGAGSRARLHPVDTRARQDGAELMYQEALPGLLEDAGGVVPACRDRPDLGLAQRLLGASVELLGAGLRRVRAAMQLEVELAHPGHKVA